MIKAVFVTAVLARTLQTATDGYYELSLSTNKDLTEYSTTVFVGSKQQPVQLILDTTASEIWFAGSNCPKSQCTG